MYMHIEPAKKFLLTKLLTRKNVTGYICKDNSNAFYTLTDNEVRL